MKKFIIGSMLTLLSITIAIGVQQGLLFSKSLPYDDEQEGLDTQITIHFSHVVAENTPKGQAANKFAELVAEKTDGQVKIKVYPNASLYNDKNEFQALQNGDVEMIAPTFSKMTTYTPNWQVLDLPFLFETDQQVFEVLTGPIGEQLLNELLPHQVRGLSFWHNGFKHLSALNKPIHTYEDLEGMNVRTMPSKVLENQFTTLGATPTATSFSEVFNDLEAKTIGAQENTASNIYSKGFYKLQPYMTLTNHGILGYAVLINENFWQTLPNNLQKQITEAMKETTVWQFEQAVKMNENDLNKLRQQSGLQIHEMSPVERIRFREKLAPVYDYYNTEIHNDTLSQIQQIVSQ